MTAAAEHRAQADRYRAQAQDSRDRSDTDGALSQWAHGRNAALEDLRARIAEDGGTAVFPALFDLDGNLLRARRFFNSFGGLTWALLDENGRVEGYFNESRSKCPDRVRRTHESKGFYVGSVRVPADAELKGGNVACVRPVLVRRDGDYSPDAEVVDNGRG